MITLQNFGHSRKWTILILWHFGATQVHGLKWIPCGNGAGALMAVRPLR